MPGPAQYPTPAKATHPSEPAGPQYLKLQALAPEYPGITVHEFKDGGANYGASSVNPVLRWDFLYDGLGLVDAAVLDSHFASADGILFGFAFRDPQTDTLYSDVHYETFERDHGQPGTWIQSRHIVLIKRPTG